MLKERLEIDTMKYNALTLENSEPTLTSHNFVGLFLM